MERESAPQRKVAIDVGLLNMYLLGYMKKDVFADLKKELDAEYASGNMAKRNEQLNEMLDMIEERKNQPKEEE